MVSATAPPNHQFLKVSFDNDQGPLGKGLLLLTLTGVQSAVVLYSKYAFSQL